jgi:hypothetical protein
MGAAVSKIRKFVNLVVSVPKVLQTIGEESRRKGTDKLTSHEIDKEIRAVRALKRKFASP